MTHLMMKMTKKGLSQMDLIKTIAVMGYQKYGEPAYTILYEKLEKVTELLS